MNKDFQLLFKAFLWRLIATLITFSIAYVVTGKVDFAAKVSFFEFFAKTFLHYIYEKVWDIKFGK